MNHYTTWFFHIWGLTLLPGSPRAPSIPWGQTGSRVLWSLLGDSFHQIMKRSVMESRSYCPADSYMITLHWISLTFSPGGPLSPGKPWWQMKQFIHETSSAFISVRPCNKYETKRHTAAISQYYTTVCHSLSTPVFLRGLPSLDPPETTKLFRKLQKKNPTKKERCQQYD